MNLKVALSITIFIVFTIASDIFNISSVMANFGVTSPKTFVLCQCEAFTGGSQDPQFYESELIGSGSSTEDALISAADHCFQKVEQYNQQNNDKALEYAGMLPGSCNRISWQKAQTSVPSNMDVFKSIN